MLIGVAVAVIPVVTYSIREERRILSKAYATGDLAVPQDAATRIAAFAKRGIPDTRLDEAFAGSHSSDEGPLFHGSSIHRVTGEREILVTVPNRVVNERSNLVHRIEQHLRGTELFEDVRILQAA